MTPTEKTDLRTMRDEVADAEDKKLLRKAINYIYELEQKLFSIRALARAISNETSTHKNEES